MSRKFSLVEEEKEVEREKEMSIKFLSVEEEKFGELVRAYPVISDKLQKGY